MEAAMYDEHETLVFESEISVAVLGKGAEFYSSDSRVK
jgi:predicted phage gp36 major capsid-like protein